MAIKKVQTDTGKTLEFEANRQERILEMSLVQKGSFIKAQGQDHEQKELHWGHEEWPLICFQVGRELGIISLAGILEIRFPGS